MASHNELRPRPRPGGARPLPPSPQPHLAELPHETEPLHLRPRTPTQRLQVPGIASRPSTPRRPVTPILSLKIPLNGRSEPAVEQVHSTPLTLAISTDSPSDINARTVRPPVASDASLEGPDQFEKFRTAISDLSILERGRERHRQSQRNRSQRREGSDDEVVTPRGYSGDDWDDDDFEFLSRLGEGAGGAVHKVRDKRSNLIMARKTIPTRTTPAIQLIRELSFMSTDHPNIIVFHGAYISPSSSEVKLLMEVCEGGSLDAVGKKVREQGRRVGEKVSAKLAEGVCLRATRVVFHLTVSIDFQGPRLSSYHEDCASRHQAVQYSPFIEGRGKAV
jgi:mitogen-activated protein kinase kinase